MAQIVGKTKIRMLELTLEEEKMNKDVMEYCPGWELFRMAVLCPFLTPKQQFHPALQVKVNRTQHLKICLFGIKIILIYFGEKADKIKL